MTHVDRKGCMVSETEGDWRGEMFEMEVGRWSCRIFERDPVDWWACCGTLA